MARKMIPLFKAHYPKGVGRKIEKVFQKEPEIRGQNLGAGQVNF